MKNTSPTNSIKRFWDRYIQYVTDNCVNLTIARWYVIRSEQYIKALPDKRLAEHCSADVIDYLEKQGRNASLEDWQFRQIVDAIQKLFAMLEISWLNEVDWQYWLHSFSLDESHPSIAREAPVEETISRLENVKHSRLTEVRRQHRDVLKKLLIELRQRGYSIRT